MIIHLLSLEDLPSCLEEADDGLSLLLGTFKFNGQIQWISYHLHSNEAIEFWLQ